MSRPPERGSEDLRGLLEALLEQNARLEARLDALQASAGQGGPSGASLEAENRELREALQSAAGEREAEAWRAELAPALASLGRLAASAEPDEEPVLEQLARLEAENRELREALTAAARDDGAGEREAEAWRAELAPALENLGRLEARLKATQVDLTPEPVAQPVEPPRPAREPLAPRARAEAPRPARRSPPGARASVLLLAALALLGVSVSLLPSPPAAARGDVVLSGVDLTLYPAADPTARWSFKASEVAYDPDSRESVVRGSSDGRRLVNGQLDLTLQADEVTIDANDNLRTQRAEIFIPKGCYRLKLGEPGAVPVYIDQNAGYRAPTADMRFPNGRLEGTNFSAPFDLSDYSLDNSKLRLEDGGTETCDAVKAAP